MDRLRWAQELQAHCRGKYVETSCTHDRSEYFRNIITDLRSQQTERPDISTCWDFHVTSSARTRLLPNKVGGTDEIVNEMLCNLPSCVVYIIHQLFLHRFHGDTQDEPIGWRQLYMIFLAKVRTARTMQDYRGITLISSLAKWYMACIVMLLKSQVRRYSGQRWRQLLIFGFEENHSIEQICVGLQLFLQKGCEWSQTFPVFVLSAEVKSAFDELGLYVVVESLLYWDFPKDLIAALIEESLDLTAVASLEGVETSPFAFTKCIRQGGMESDWLWSLVVRRILDSCLEKWGLSGYGVNLPILGLTNHVVWADNACFVGHSLENVLAMAQDVTDV